MADNERDGDDLFKVTYVEDEVVPVFEFEITTNPEENPEDEQNSNNPNVAV